MTLPFGRRRRTQRSKPSRAQSAQQNPHLRFQTDPYYPGAPQSGNYHADSGSCSASHLPSSSQAPQRDDDPYFTHYTPEWENDGGWQYTDSPPAGNWGQKKWHKPNSRRAKMLWKRLSTDPFLHNVYYRLRSSKTPEEIIDILLELPEKDVARRLEKILAKSPQATTSALIDKMQKDYIRLSGTTAGAVGAGAAWPGIGTAAAVGLSGLEMTLFALESIYYVLSVASLCGVHPDEKDQRRALVLSALMGDEGSKIVSQQLGLSTLNWARTSLMSMSTPTLSRVNAMLVNYAKRSIAKKMSKKLLGRLIPFGIGAVVGLLSGRHMARNVIEGTSIALGAPPQESAAQAIADTRRAIKAKKDAPA